MGLQGKVFAIVGVLVLAGLGLVLFSQNRQVPTDSQDVMMDGTSDSMIYEDGMDRNGSRDDVIEISGDSDRMGDGDMMGSDMSPGIDGEPDDHEVDPRYVEYSEGILESTAASRRVLFFYADWCPTCQPTDTDIMRNVSNLPDDVTVIRVNYNDDDTDENEKALAKQYGVSYQHTFVQIDPSGKEVTRWNGGMTDELLSRIQ